MTQTDLLPKLPGMVEGESNVLWGVPDDVLLLLKQYDFSDHVTPTYTVTGSPNGLHFICVWPTKESKVGDKVLHDMMKILQITDTQTNEVACQTDDLHHEVGKSWKKLMKDTIDRLVVAAIVIVTSFMIQFKSLYERKRKGTIGQ